MADADPKPSPPRRRLDHIDAMRPVKQLGVLSTHSLLYFAPAASVYLGAALTLLHVSREGFLFVSACMLTYAYYDLTLHDLRRFWKRRLVAVGLPYLCWTVIYFLIGLPGLRTSPGGAAEHFGFLVLTGYSQLYFLVVLLEFYVLFPLVVALLKATRRHHLALLLVSLAFQLGYMTAMHWGMLPTWLTGTAGTREVVTYQLYLLAGSLAAVHYEAVHRFFVTHLRQIALATLATAAVAEAWYFLSLRPGFGFLGAPADAFQPVVIPFNLCAIALIYDAGVALVRPRRSDVPRRLAHVSSDNSYAIYLSQVLFLSLLSAAGFGRLERYVPWPFVVAAAVLIVFTAGCLLGGIFARTPLALPVAGRHQLKPAPLALGVGQPPAVPAVLDGGVPGGEVPRGAEQPGQARAEHPLADDARAPAGGPIGVRVARRTA